MILLVGNEWENNRIQGNERGVIAATRYYWYGMKGISMVQQDIIGTLKRLGL